MIRNIKTFIFYGSAAILGGLLASVFLLVLVSHHSAPSAIALKPYIPPVNYFASTTIEAKAAYVYDVKNNKILYAKDPDDSLPLASLTKLMTAVTALSEAPTSTVVTVTPQALAETGDNGLYSNERWFLDSLLKFTLVVSSNDGAAAVAQALGMPAALASGQTVMDPSASTSVSDFVDQMNTNAKKLNLTHTKFFNPTGLDLDATAAGAYGSARDVAALLTYAVATYPNVVDTTQYANVSATSLNYIVHNASNTDELVGTIPGLVAGKTGYTDLAGGNLAVEADLLPNHSVVIVVLGSSYDGRFTDMSALVSAATTALQNGQ